MTTITNITGVMGMAAGHHSTFVMSEMLPSSLVIGFAVFYWLILAVLSYTFGQVIATLAMVEAPQTTTTTTVKAKEVGDKEMLLDLKEGIEETEEAEEAEEVTKLPPITSNLFGSVRELRARSGKFAAFRGLPFFCLYSVVSALTCTLLQQMHLGTFISTCGSILLLARLNMAWTHRVISTPRQKRWGRPDFKEWKKLLPATALYAGAYSLDAVYPAVYFWATGLHRFLVDPELFRTLDSRSQSCAVLGFLCFIVTGIGLSAFMLLPTVVTLVRVQASLLPAEDEPIFPFDRTFGGRVVSEADGGNGTLSIRDAWQSFDWASRLRLVKIYAKLAAIEFAVTLTFMGTLVVCAVVL